MKKNNVKDMQVKINVNGELHELKITSLRCDKNTDTSLYRKFNVCLCCFDLTKKKSFENLINHCDIESVKEGAQKILVGNKCDLKKRINNDLNKQAEKLKN